MKIVKIGVILALFGHCATAAEWVRDRPYFIPAEMKLTVTPSFEGSVEYQIISHTSPTELVKSEFRLVDGGRESLENTSVAFLSDQEYQNLVEKLKIAISFEYGELPGIEDGEQWCVESWIFQSIKVCVDTPDLATEERGYGGLVEFRRYLESLF